MAASLQHRPRRRAGPAGTFVDVARVEAVVPVERPLALAESSPPPGESRPTAPSPSEPAPVGDLVPAPRRARTIPAADRATPLPSPADLAVDISVVWPEAPRPTPVVVPVEMPPLQWSRTRGFEPLAHATRERAAPPPAQEDDPTPVIRYLPVPGPRLETPPQEVVDLVERATGVRVADATIDRSPDVSERAAAMGAVAFTERATVHLPAELGSADTPGVRAVIAHELTHVAQQRVLGGTMPGEDSAPGRALEREAMAVQIAAGGRASVEPLFLRQSPVSAATPPGVQRLRQNEDPYAWQGRDPEDDVTGADIGLGMIGLRVKENSRRGRRRRDAVESGHQQFEVREAKRLEKLRHDHYAELIQKKEREMRIEALRSGRDVEPLAWEDRVAVREQLDTEMPYEFGVPEDISPYPDMHLKPPEEVPPPDPPNPQQPHPQQPAGRTAKQDPKSPAHRVAPTTKHGGRLDHPDTRTADRALARAGHRESGGHGDGPADYGWQDREPTGKEAATALFGDTFLGGLFGKLAGDEKSDRKASEKERLESDLLPRRKEREKELRHVVLREKRLEVLRGGGKSTGTVRLTTDEIARVRAAVDEEMPLEFAMPEYLDAEVDTGIDESGAFVRTQPIPPDQQEAPVPNGPPGGAGQTGHTTSGGTVAGLATVANTIGQATGGDHHGAPARESDADTARRVFAAATDLDIEVLTRRLYGRIRRELRGELLIDRERAGLLADAR